MWRFRHAIGRVVAYHGCDLAIAKQLVANKTTLNVSSNKYDWLGDGAYFWIASPQRAIDWAIWKHEQGEIDIPSAVGAFIHLGSCLNLTDLGMMDDIRKAHKSLELLITSSGADMPINTTPRHGVMMRRFLDCAVFNMAHLLRSREGKLPYDTVLGMFEEGPDCFPGSCFKDKTHIQLAVRNTECVIGYFQIPGLDYGF
jgi:hypothetical protein